MSHASALQSLGHGDGGPARQQLKLNDFGGNLHSSTICALAQQSRTDLGALAQREAAYLWGILGCMGQTATERHAHYRRQVAVYLRAVEMARSWSQSEIARQAGVLSTTVNKAMHLRHSMNYPTLLAIESASGVVIPDELKRAATGLNAPRVVEPSEVDAFLAEAPEWKKMVELGRQLTEATDPETKRKLKREISNILASVA